MFVDAPASLPKALLIPRTYINIDVIETKQTVARKPTDKVFSPNSVLHQNSIAESTTNEKEIFLLTWKEPNGLEIAENMIKKAKAAPTKRSFSKIRPTPDATGANTIIIITGASEAETAPDSPRYFRKTPLQSSIEMEKAIHLKASGNDLEIDDSVFIYPTERFLF
jgi:hypothetical protein